jgi:hypothetical protein
MIIIIFYWAIFFHVFLAQEKREHVLWKKNTESPSNMRQMIKKEKINKIAKQFKWSKKIMTEKIK